VSALEGTVDTFRRWMHLPDPAPLLAVLGTVAANRLPGDPVWLQEVAAPSSGKSEILQAVCALPGVHAWAAITEGGLLSGTPKREKATNATGGVLKVVGNGNSGIAVAKDFGSVLSMNRDSRLHVLAALREVHDGAWTRHLGTDGGQTLSWYGKLGLLAGVTPTIDRHHAVMGALGERFILHRWPPADARAQARKALERREQPRKMRAELADAVTALFQQPLLEVPELSHDDTERLVALAVLVAKCRSAVERDGYTREIELLPEPEAPARLTLMLSGLLDGLRAIGIDRDTAWEVLQAAALDSIPAIRRAVIEALLGAGQMTKAQAAEAIGCPPTTTHRALEDLVALKVLDANRQAKPMTWQIAHQTAENWDAATCPEMSGGGTADLSRNVGQGIGTSHCTHTTCYSGQTGEAANAPADAALQPRPAENNAGVPTGAYASAANDEGPWAGQTLDYLEAGGATQAERERGAA
jgi:hypothetical protein